MARENPGWGYTRIQGASANLSHHVGRGTVSNVLKRKGMEPAPERSMRTTWSKAWMLQVGRNLIGEESGALASKRYLIIDRDTKYTRQFRRLVEEGGESRQQ